jgi:hypothetical protein
MQLRSIENERRVQQRDHNYAMTNEKTTMDLVGEHTTTFSIKLVATDI